MDALNTTRLGWLLEIVRNAVPLDGVLWSEARSPAADSGLADALQVSAPCEPADAQPSSVVALQVPRSPSP